MGVCDSNSNTNKPYVKNPFYNPNDGINKNNIVKNGKYYKNGNMNGISKKINNNDKKTNKPKLNSNDTTHEKKRNTNGTNEKKRNSNETHNKKEDEHNQQLIRIIFYDNNIEIFSRPYPKETKFENIIKDLNIKCKSDEKYYDILNNDLNYNIKNKILNFSKTINEYRENEEEKNLYINIDVKGLRDISSNCDSYIYENIRVLGKIYFSPFELYIYNILENILRKVNISEEEINYSNIEKVTNITSFCHGINKLYLFSGKENNNLISYFWIIDLKQLKIRKLDSNFQPRKDNSLIYIPKKYVFIIGGQNEKSVYYFDTYKEKFFTYPNLENIFIKPALILIDNTFLYVFSNIENKFLIEKTNLRKEPKWEKIIPKIPENIIVNQQNFSVCKSDYNSIIFIGGEVINDNKENENNIFEFDLNNNQIYQSISKYFYYDLTEKTFIPFNEYKYFLFKNNSNRDLIIIYFDKKTNIIEEIRFENDNEKNYKYKPIKMSQTKIVFENSKFKDINSKEINEDNVMIFDNNDKIFGTLDLSDHNNLSISENDKKYNKTLDKNLYSTVENEKIIQNAANLIFGKDIQKKNTKKNSPNKKNRHSVDNTKNDDNGDIVGKIKLDSNRNYNFEDKNNLFFNLNDSDLIINNEDKKDDKNKQNKNEK